MESCSLARVLLPRVTRLEPTRGDSRASKRRTRPAEPRNAFRDDTHDAPTGREMPTSRQAWALTPAVRLLRARL
jgi:hypothetical protein